ncbi:MAG: 2-hydroxyacyl-CoA dehydratase [Phycisphaerae bacterium]|nr:2-hydroxyacyl-CoA dehydratase [Phycisphaerae bacterium]
MSVAEESVTDRESKSPRYIRLKSSVRLHRLMRWYYTYAKLMPRMGKKIAWITSGGPVEPLYAAGIIPVYPENHGALCGAARQGPKLSERAEAMGFSRDVCSYARCDIACAVEGIGPIGGLPRPDLLVCCNNICGTVTKWYEVLARHFNVPLVVIDTPFLHDGELREHVRRYVRPQFDELIVAIENVTRKSFSERRLGHRLELSLECIQAWRRILGYCEHRPSPISCFDAFGHMFPIVTLRGTRWATRYYRHLEAEIAERVERGFGAVPQERIRLLWDNIPIWYEISRLFKQLAEHGACLVADTYTNAWTMDQFDKERSLDSLAEAYTSIFLNVGVRQRYAQTAALAKRFKVDGVVMHSNRSCKPYSFGQLDIQRWIRQELGLPCLLIEADMTDSRSYSREQVRARLDAFLETLEPAA